MTIIKHEWNTPGCAGSTPIDVNQYFADLHKALTTKSTWTWVRTPGDWFDFDSILSKTLTVPELHGFRVYKFNDDASTGANAAPIFIRVDFYTSGEGSRNSPQFYSQKMYPCFRIAFGGNRVDSVIDSDSMVIQMTNFPLPPSSGAGNGIQFLGIGESKSYIYTDTERGQFLLNFGVQSRVGTLNGNATGNQFWKSRLSSVQFGFERTFSDDTGTVLKDTTYWLLPPSLASEPSSAQTGKNGRWIKYDNISKAWATTNDWDSSLWNYVGKRSVSDLTTMFMYQPMYMSSSDGGLVASRFFCLYRLKSKTPFTRETITINGVPTPIFHHDMNRNLVVSDGKAMNMDCEFWAVEDNYNNVCLGNIERS